MTPVRIDAVGPRERLGFVAEFLHGNHRPEDLTLDHLVVLAQIGDHGGLDEVADLADLVSAGRHGRVTGGATEKSGHTLELN